MRPLDEATEAYSMRTKTRIYFQLKIWKESCGWKGQRGEELDIEIKRCDWEFEDELSIIGVYHTKFEKRDIETDIQKGPDE